MTTKKREGKRRRSGLPPPRRTKTNKITQRGRSAGEGLGHRRRRPEPVVAAAVPSVASRFPQWPNSTGLDSIMTRLNRASTCTVIWPLTALRFPCCMAAGCSPAENTNTNYKPRRCWAHPGFRGGRNSEARSGVFPTWISYAFAGSCKFP